MRYQDLPPSFNAFPNPNNALNNLHRRHVASHTSAAFDDVHVFLSNHFSRMSVFHEQGNVNVNVMDSLSRSRSPHTQCSSDVRGHAHTCYGLQNENPLFHASNCNKRTMDSHVRTPFMLSQPNRVSTNTNTPSSHYFTAATTDSEFSHSRGDPVIFQCDSVSGFIMQDKDVKCCVAGRGSDSLWGCNEALPFPRLVSSARREKSSILASLSPWPLFNFAPLAKFQGYIYRLAKDQNGCRFLQRILDEGTSEDAQLVFNGVIDDIVELMMDPFGNYLVQKLLDVCGEHQRLQVVSMLTKEPGQLVKTSLNTHGTRVVQKLIATVNSRKQFVMLRSVIQPGFLDLIKDLNGNHVIQRCLQYFSCNDNEFIFDAATKFCVDIATHQHGCCVLQRCIDYSTGKYQDKLVKEICRHGLILAQDPFGNYVVQYIIEMEDPNLSSKLHSQFKGNYVNLSMQKFSSHVVEKCLMHVAESRSRIVQELLSFPNFERLLPDPYANYVVQRALGVTKGSLHSSLVEAVRPHKILRTSPYCKKIFSRNLLNK